MNKITTSAGAMLALCSLASSTELPGTASARAPESVGAARSVKRPNILFILADDLGWRDTAVYGSAFYETPNINALARSGMRFANAYAAHPLCSPTRASILTGQYPVRTGLTAASGHLPGKQAHQECTAGPDDVRACGPSSLNYLDPKHYTLGEALRDAGYATGFFGKWHMGHAPEYYPENHGFEYVKGGRWHPGPPGRNPARKFYPPWDCDTLEPNPPADIHVDDYLAGLAINYIKQQKEMNKPFFVCYWAYSVHAPFQSKPELIEKWKKKIDPKNPQHAPTMAAMIEVLDTNVGRLLAALKEQGLEENTIVIFTSDNGGNTYATVDGTTPTSNAPLRNGKGNNYEGGVRVPLIVRWPGVTRAGSVNDAVVSSVDHYPTILEMTGQRLRPADHKDGVSYAPALQGQPFDRGPTICDMPHPVRATGNIPNTSLRLGDWKMYRFWYDNPRDQTHRYELYNLRADIGETQDLSAAQPAQLRAMIAALDAFYSQTGVLSYHPNSRYNRRTVGMWFATSDNGKLEARSGTLVMRSDRPGFAVTTLYRPNTDQNGFLAFEARSASGVSLRMPAPQGGEKILPLSHDWTAFEIPLREIVFSAGKFFVALSEAGEAELRQARVLSADKTEMMRYLFY